MSKNFTLHDLMVVLYTFVAGMAVQLMGTNGSITQSTIVSAVIAGLVAVGHKYFPKETS